MSSYKISDVILEQNIRREILSSNYFKNCFPLHKIKSIKDAYKRNLNTIINSKNDNKKDSMNAYFGKKNQQDIKKNVINQSKSKIAIANLIFLPPIIKSIR